MTFDIYMAVNHCQYWCQKSYQDLSPMPYLVSNIEISSTLPHSAPSTSPKINSNWSFLFGNRSNSNRIDNSIKEIELSPQNLKIRSLRNVVLYKFFIAQWKNPSKGDWTEQVKADLIEFGISMDFNDIKRKSKDAFKRLVKSRTKEIAFRKLSKMKNEHSKMSNLEYSELEINKLFAKERDPKKKTTEIWTYVQIRCTLPTL